MDRLTSSRLDQILHRARDLRVLVVGDLMLDVYLRGAASRISPEAPVPVVRVSEEWRALGGAANVAANVVALGAQCTVVGTIGRDAAGAELRQELAECGITDDALVEVEGRPTTVKTRVMVRHHQVARYDIEMEDDVEAEITDALIASIHEQIDKVDAVVLEDYNKGVLVPRVIQTAIAAARLGNKPVIVDPKYRSFFDYAGASVFKPNLIELQTALRAEVEPDDPEWLEQIRRRLDCEHLLVTLGEDGMALRSADGAYMRVPTMARSVYDVSGAGDTVTATLAVALAAGESATGAAVLANHAAGIEVGKAGVATVSPDELREVVREHHERAVSASARD